jgi:hypothetical protein
MPVSETSLYSAGKGYGEMFEQMLRFPLFENRRPRRTDSPASPL